MEILEDLFQFLLAFRDALLYFLPGTGRPDRVLTLVLGHLTITFASVLLATAIGVALGILITRIRVLYGPVIAVAGMIYTIPSLALFGLLIPIVGIGVRPAIIALTLYSLLAIIRNTAVGLNEIDAAIIEAARGMGMTNGQILVKIEVPLALPVMFAGIRLATVAAISLATIASFFGASGLGSLLFEGLAAGGTRNDKIIAGALAASVLAVLFSQLIGRAEKALRQRTM